jgi:DNA polymerase (family X)
VQYLYFRLGIKTLEDLDTLVRSHLLRTLPGVVVMEEELIAAITILKARGQAKIKGEEISSLNPQS